MKDEISPSSFFLHPSSLLPMTSHLYLDWPILAVSLFNTILMLWLGMTILLNAERRTWGLWLTGSSLLLGAGFFISHSAILGRGPLIGAGMDFWWHVGWAPVIGLPFAWYAVTLWYTGFWDDTQTALHRRHRPLLVCTALLTTGLVGLLLFANPLPSFTQVAQLDLSAPLSIGGLPLLIIAYPIYILLCISLSLDALLRPGPTARMMGSLARRRARPWLVATAITLLVVSLLVAWVMLWITSNARQRTLAHLLADMAITVGWFDLIIAALIASATLMIGRAVVSYEVFTGKTLPRGGFRRYWRSAVILAAGYSVVVSGSLTLQLRPIYSLLLTTVLMTAFYALFSWRSYVERDRYMHQFRPLSPASACTMPADARRARDGFGVPFRASVGMYWEPGLFHLAGPRPRLSNLPGYPNLLAVPALTDLAAQFDSPQTMCLPLDPARYHGALWAVPLWSERGLIGLLLLGEKVDHGLYTQEEIEIARASGERLIDTQASTEMSRRLMALQRQRLAESQVLDRRARRVLHDDTLPRLHAALLSMSSNPANAEAITLLAEVHRQISDLLREMPPATTPEVARLGLIGALRRMVDDELRQDFDAVTWEVEPEAERKAQSLPPVTAEVLFYAAREAIRNAARYGRDSKANESRPLHLRVAALWQDGLKISIEDDGVGLGAADQSKEGGHGLALHSTMLAVVGGFLALESRPDAFTRVSLTLPVGMW
jgi:signal transduction histidine kinase